MAWRTVEGHTYNGALYAGGLYGPDITIDSFDVADNKVTFSCGGTPTNQRAITPFYCGAGWTLAEGADPATLPGLSSAKWYISPYTHHTPSGPWSSPLDQIITEGAFGTVGGIYDLPASINLVSGVDILNIVIKVWESGSWTSGPTAVKWWIYAYGTFGATDGTAGTSTPAGGEIDNAPAPDTSDDLPSGGGHTIEIPPYNYPDGPYDPALPDIPQLPVIRAPDGTAITPDDGAVYEPMPAGLAPDAPIKLIIVGRFLQAFAGGKRIAAYLIPQTVWDGLSTAEKQYVGYRDTASGNAEVNAPNEDVTVTIGSSAASFSLGSVREQFGVDHRLWAISEVDIQKNILVNSGVASIKDYYSQDEVSAADKVLLAGRNNSVSLSYSEALSAANVYGSSAIVLPVVN